MPKPPGDQNAEILKQRFEQEHKAEFRAIEDEYETQLEKPRSTMCNFCTG